MHRYKVKLFGEFGKEQRDFDPKQLKKTKFTIIVRLFDSFYFSFFVRIRSTVSQHVRSSLAKLIKQTFFRQLISRLCSVQTGQSFIIRPVYL